MMRFDEKTGLPVVEYIVDQKRRTIEVLAPGATAVRARSDNKIEVEFEGKLYVYDVPVFDDCELKP